MRDIILTALMLWLIPWSLFRPDVGILVWTWIGLMNPHRLTWGFAANQPWAFAVAIVTLLAIVISREPKRLPLTPPVVVLFLFVLWMTVTTIFFSLFPELAWEKWEKVAKVQLFIFLTILVMQTRERIRNLVFVATYSVAFFGIKGGVYTIMQGGRGMVLGPEGSFISGNTEIALALTMTLPLMWWSYLQIERRWLKRAILVAMGLVAIAVIGSYSRGGFLAIAAMALMLWLKSRSKGLLGVALVAAVPALIAFMPQEWFQKMYTIKTYEEDASAMGRIGAWRFVTNLIADRPIWGGGFATFELEAYAIYAPNEAALDPHSIWFAVLGEHGIVGLGLFILLWILTWRTGLSVIKACRNHAELRWASDLAAMTQVAFVGYWVGGSFLGLAYWDYPYVLMAVLVLTQAVVANQLKEGAAAGSPVASRGGALPAQGR